jgi:hypothetical protein
MTPAELSLHPTYTATQQREQAQSEPLALTHDSAHQS